MKYFTPDLLRSLRSESQEEREEAQHRWLDNTKAYVENLSTIESRLSRRFWSELHKAHGFHDAHVSELRIEQRRFGHFEPVSVTLVLDQGGTVWTIAYARVTVIEVRYSSDRRPAGSWSWGLDDLLYDELGSTSATGLSHEILFASGASIYIEFAKAAINHTSSRPRATGKISASGVSSARE
jgi:hypothetical protein